MAGYIVNASIDERGKASGGIAGDQTGKEVCTRTWYSRPWDMMIRYPDKEIAKRARDIAIKIANSNLVGYDQAGRNTLYNELAKYKWDVDKYLRSGERSECDCSSFVYTVYCVLIPKLRGCRNAPTTSTSENFYKQYGFNVYKSKEYLQSTSKLVAGDLLNAAGHHIVMYCGNNTNITKEKSNSNVKYYKKCRDEYVSLVDALSSIGVDSSFNTRKKIAYKNGIKNYSGTSEQNTKLLCLLKNGKLIK